MSKCGKGKKALPEEESKGYRIRNPFTKYYFNNVLQYYRIEVSNLYKKALTLLSIVVALLAAPVYMVSDLLEDTPLFFDVIPFICLILSFVHVFLSFLKVIDHGRGKAIEIEVPADEPFTVDYEERHENELWYLDIMRRVSNETISLYDILITEYKYSVTQLRKTLIFFGGIVIYFMLLKVVYVL